MHGTVPKNSLVKLGDQAFPANDIAVLLLRLLLRNYLLADEPWTPDSLDQLILGRMKRTEGYVGSMSD